MPTPDGICPYYGRNKYPSPNCETCGIRQACSEAVDIPPLLRPQNSLADHDVFLGKLSAKVLRYNSPEKEMLRYTLGDLMHLVRVMAAMDDVTLFYLDELFKHGCGTKFADIARTRNISRQAVHKKIKHELQKFPELAAVFYPGGRPRNRCSQQTYDAKEAANE